MLEVLCRLGSSLQCSARSVPLSGARLLVITARPLRVSTFLLLDDELLARIRIHVVLKHLLVLLRCIVRQLGRLLDLVLLQTLLRLVAGQLGVGGPLRQNGLALGLV